MLNNNNELSSAILKSRQCSSSLNRTKHLILYTLNQSSDKNVYNEGILNIQFYCVIFVQFLKLVISRMSEEYDEDELDILMEQSRTVHWKPITKKISFPEPRDIVINMMPFLVDVDRTYSTIPTVSKRPQQIIVIYCEHHRNIVSIFL